MLNLVSLALLTFALALVAFGAWEWIAASRHPLESSVSRTRLRTHALFAVAIGVLLAAVYLFLASRFSLQLFGRLLVPLNLPKFVDRQMSTVAIIVGALVLASLPVILMRSRALVAYALIVVCAIAFLGIGLWVSNQTHDGAASTAASGSAGHPPIENVQVVKGFTIKPFAREVDDPSAITTDDRGNLYYAQLVDGGIIRLADTNGDGVADETKTFASGFVNPRGLAFHNGKLYVSSRGQVNVLTDVNGDGSADQNEVLLTNLFSLDIQHSNNGLAFGPDGRLYIAQGGPRVHQLDLNGNTYTYQGKTLDEWMIGGILVADADGRNLRMFAKGLRNPYDLAFDSKGHLFATDNGDDTIPVPDGDELNLIEAGADYGYPYFFGLPPAWSNTRAPLVAFDPHSAPTGVTVYDGKNFPADWNQNIFVALFWRGRSNVTGREVVRITNKAGEESRAARVHDFVQGLDRPVDVIEGTDGALYIADMRGGKADPEFPGIIYRVTYQGK